VFQLEQDQGGAGDPGDAAGVETDSAESLEGDLEQGVGAFGDGVDAADNGVNVWSASASSAPLGFLTGWRKPSPTFS
jgi:hypothetical protein